MELGELLQEQGSIKVERPPTLWEADTEVEPFLRLLGEMVAIGLARGNGLDALTLNVSNLTVVPDDEGGWIPDGDYVAITVRGAGAWDDDVWRADQEPTGPLSILGPAAEAAGVVYAYARNLGAEGSVTALLPRLVPPT